MPSARVELAQIEAELAEARLRRDDLDYSWAVATYSSSGTRRPEDVDVELARVNAQIAALEERREALLAAPANDAAPAPALARPPEPASAAPAALPEYLDTKQAAALLGVSTDTLERLRAPRQGQPPGPPFKRVGRRVIYSVAGLREYDAKK